MRLFAGIAMLALLLPGTTAAQSAAPSLASAVEELTREWYEQQTGDLPPDELPEQEILIVDIAEMRDNVMRRVSEVLENSDALAGGIPDDAANTAALIRLVEAYEGLESMTPVFTQLALSKASDPAYQSGWRLCAIRVVAETWLSQILETRAQMDTVVLPPCEADLRPVEAEMLPLQPPRTEFRPGGSVVVEFGVAPTGAVSNPWFVEWNVTPSDEFMRDYVTRSVLGWKYPPRESACRLQRSITFEIVKAE